MFTPTYASSSLFISKKNIGAWDSKSDMLASGRTQWPINCIKEERHKGQHNDLLRIIKKERHKGQQPTYH